MSKGKGSDKIASGITRSTSPLFLCLIAAILFCSCTQFSQVGTRWVRHQPIREGPVSTEFDSYGLVRVLSFPTKDSPQLRLYQEKIFKVKIQYAITSHEENVLKRKPTRLEKSLENTGKTFENNPVLGVFSLAFLPLDILVGSTPSEETKYERLPEPERSEWNYKYETKVVPAASEIFKAVGMGNAVTDINGIAEFQTSPERFDKGQYIYHEGSGLRYLVQREKLTREVKAPWYPEANIAALLVSTALTVRGLENIIAIGGGPYAIAAVIIKHVVIDVAVGYIIDVAATKTEEYYQWIVIRK